MANQRAKFSAKANIAPKLHILAPPTLKYPQYQTQPSNQMPPKQGANWLAQAEEQLAKSWVKVFKDFM